MNIANDEKWNPLGDFRGSDAVWNRTSRSKLNEIDEPKSVTDFVLLNLLL